MGRNNMPTQYRGRVFPSIKELAEHLYVSPTDIQQALNRGTLDQIPSREEIKGFHDKIRALLKDGPRTSIDLGMELGMPHTQVSRYLRQLMTKREVVREWFRERYRYYLVGAIWDMTFRITQKVNGEMVSVVVQAPQVRGIVDHYINAAIAGRSPDPRGLTIVPMLSIYIPVGEEGAPSADALRGRHEDEWPA